MVTGRALERQAKWVDWGGGIKRFALALKMLSSNNKKKITEEDNWMA